MLRLHGSWTGIYGLGEATAFIRVWLHDPSLPQIQNSAWRVWYIQVLLFELSTLYILRLTCSYTLKLAFYQLLHTLNVSCPLLVESFSAKPITLYFFDYYNSVTLEVPVSSSL